MSVKIHTTALFLGYVFLLQVAVHAGSDTLTEMIGFGHALHKRQSAGPSLSLEVEVVSEGVGTIEVCTLGGSTSAFVVLNTTDDCGTSSSDACDGNDYIGFSETFTLNPGDMTCFDIAIVDDTDLEFIEEFRVELTTGGIPADSATVYIRENDEAPSLQVLVYQFIIDEGIDIVEVCALGGSVGVPVLLSTSDTCGSTCAACGGSDYVAINEAFTIYPGETRCFNLTIVDDPDPECTTESFNIELTNVGSPLVCSHSITLHIKDNEEAPTLDIRTPSNVVDENTGFLEVCVLGGSVPYGVLLRTANCPSCQRATSNVDFSRIQEMFLIIPGQTICFNIFIADDNIAEISESFGVQLIDSTNGILLESPVVHIRDDDKAPVLEVSQHVVDEGIGSLGICVVGTDVSISVILTTVIDCSSSTDACVGDDFSGINEAFTTNPGETACFNIAVVDDQLVEFTEEIAVVLTNQPGQPIVFFDGTIIYIRDNEEAPRLAGGCYMQVDEDSGTVSGCVVGGNIAVPVMLTTGSDCNEAGMASGGSDYSTVNEAFTINPEEMQCFDITIVDDIVVENTESICVKLESANSSQIFESSLQLDIKDNDAPTLEPQLSSLITDEGVGAIGVCVVGGSATVSAVLITPGIYDDATEGDDYTGINEAFTISSGERKCFSVAIVDDSEVESTENLNIFLSTSGFTDSIYNIILDNDSPFLSQMTYQSVEGNKECSLEEKEQSEGSDDSDSDDSESEGSDDSESDDSESEGSDDSDSDDSESEGSDDSESDDSESEGSDDSDSDDSESDTTESCAEKVCISRGNGLGVPVNAIFATSYDITTEQEDYIGVIHSFCIGHGEEICFDVSIVDDMVPELQEDLQVTLTSTVRNEISLVQIEESDVEENGTPEITLSLLEQVIDDSESCPPECTFEFCWSERRNRRRATCTLPGNGAPDGCLDGCHITSCRACYFSEEVRDTPEDCQTCQSAKKKERCLKRWGKCVYRNDLQEYGQAPRTSRTAELFKCYSHPCLALAG